MAKRITSKKESSTTSNNNSINKSPTTNNGKKSQKTSNTANQQNNTNAATKRSRSKVKKLSGEQQSQAKEVSSTIAVPTETILTDGNVLQTSSMMISQPVTNHTVASGTTTTTIQYVFQPNNVNPISKPQQNYKANISQQNQFHRHNNINSNHRQQSDGELHKIMDHQPQYHQIKLSSPTPMFNKTGNQIITAAAGNKSLISSKLISSSPATTSEFIFMKPNNNPTLLNQLTNNNIQNNQLTTSSPIHSSTSSTIAATSAATKVVSSNPTLNFLLSTPINGTVVSCAITNSTTTTTNTPNVDSSRSVTTNFVKTSGSGLGKTKNVAKTRIILNPSKQQSSNTLEVQQQIQKTLPQKRLKTTSNQQSTKKSTTTSISYLDEIRKMMHSFGDVRQPLVESAKMIESIVQHQMQMLLLEAESVAKQRGQCKHISLEDFLFLLKHDRHKLAKLIRYLKFKDMKLKVLSSMLPQANDDSKIATKKTVKSTKLSKLTLESFYNDLKTELDHDNTPLMANGAGGESVCESTGGDDLTSKQSSSSCSFPMSSTSNAIHTNNPNGSKRVKICHDFLMSIVDTPERGNLERLFEPDFIDDYTFARNCRLNEFARAMSVKEYLFYQSCRLVTFFGSSASNKSPMAVTSTISPAMFHKFQDWILMTNSSITKDTKLSSNHQQQRQPLQLTLQPNLLAWEVVQYLAHETVAILVELALMIKHDQQRPSRPGQSLYPDTIEYETMSAKCFRQQISSKNSLWKTNRGDILLNQSFQVNHQSKINSSTSGQQLGKELFVTECLRRTSEKVRVFQSPLKNDDDDENEHQTKPSTVERGGLDPWHNAIKPEHILEALRRFETGTNIFNRFGRCHGWLFGQNRKKRILCLC